jgi:tight adherence protein C
MTRIIVVAGISFWIGMVLLLAEIPFFRRTPLAERLRPYAQGKSARRGSRPFSTSSFRDVIAPLAQTFGGRFARFLGVSEAAALRLERIHAPLDATAFRLKQLGWSILGFGVGGTLSWIGRLPAAVALLFTLAGPLLGFMIVEQNLASASQRWRRRMFLELPVVEEQLAILLTAGYSLGAALNRVATRGDGCVSKDLRRVCLRVRQGITESAALREWAELADVEAVHRLTAILSLSQEASDLGRMVSDEARNTRRDVHRELIEAVERKGQQVWIPVTVATLLPGVIFIAVPFLNALKLYAS